MKVCEDPFCQTAETHNEYRESITGANHLTNKELSPNVDYWVEGEIIEGPTVGESLLMKRKIRNGIEVDGYFSTSPITKITADGFHTMNSEYKVEEV